MGQYRVVARLEGLSPADTPVELGRDSETRLREALVLSDPVRLEVAVSPPRHPDGDRWTVLVERPGRLRQAAGTDGVAVLPAVPAGEHTLTIEAAGQRWFSERIALAPGAGPVHVQLPFVAVNGRITVGGRPVAAEAAFGAFKGTTSVALRSDAEGSFEGWLPRAGRWPVEVHVPAEELMRMLEVDVPEHSGTEARSVDIDLPDGVLRGVVVDERARPVSNADVHYSAAKTASAPVKGVRTRTDGDGAFLIRGLPYGSGILEARTIEAYGTLEVQVSEGPPPGDVRLTVQSKQAFRARVVTEAGLPLVGATVIVAPSRGPGLYSPVETTNAEGRFTASMPRGCDAVNVVVTAAGYGAKMARLAVTGGPEHVIAVARGGGRLRIESPSIDGPRVPIVLLHGGAWTHPVLLAGGPGQAPRAVSPAALSLPLVAAGDYEACLATPDEMLAGGRPDPGRCTRGLVESGGELVLQLPEPRH